MEGKHRIIISKNFDPAYNLGLEEYLISKGENVLYLWQNDNTIVIGRNQNPYKECNIERIEKDRVNLMRRRSGGGAVFHDLGNLNFTIISEKNDNNIEENFELVNQVLASIGVESIFNGRNDLHVDGKKISGNAFFSDKNIFCHHGTLLLDVDMDKLGNYLTASKLKLESKGIDSVKSRVLNLKDIDSSIDVNRVIDAFIKTYKENFETGEVEYISKNDMEKDSDIMDKVKRYKSWQWVYGESPKSNISFEEKFSWGIIEFSLNIDSGIIKDAKIYTDSIINDRFIELSEKLKGIKFKRAEILRLVGETLKNKKIIEDINSMKALSNIK